MNRMIGSGLLALSLFILPATGFSQDTMTPEQEEQLKQAIESLPDEYEKNLDNVKRVITGGVPLGRWNEGLLFEGIEPQP